ncbi:MAG TPA: hypothetical protein VFO41_15165 [Alphaproteobacteria bacterium]|nr:hypothetical protein [Alphaproteobacteria bacterium]
MDAMGAATVSLLIVIGVGALDYGTLQQITSLIAYMRDADRNVVELTIRRERQYKARVLPGLISVCFLVTIVCLYPRYLALLTIAAVAFAVMYFALQTVGYLSVLRKLK